MRTENDRAIIGDSVPGHIFILDRAADALTCVTTTLYIYDGNYHACCPTQQKPSSIRSIISIRHFEPSYFDVHTNIVLHCSETQYTSASSTKVPSHLVYRPQRLAIYGVSDAEDRGGGRAILAVLQCHPRLEAVAERTGGRQPGLAGSRLLRRRRNRLPTIN